MTVRRAISILLPFWVLLWGLGIGAEARAQHYLSRDSAWVFSGNTSLTFSQVGLTNWVAGGENTYGGQATLFLNLEFKRGKQLLKKTLDVGYGLMQYGEEGVRKNLDKLDFAAQYGYQVGKVWYISALYTLKTQFSPGYKYPDVEHKISDFASPLYNALSVGIDYKPIPSVSVLISPVAGRVTYVRSQVLADLGAFGVEPAVRSADGAVLTPGRHELWELGGMLKATFVQSFFDKKFGVNSKLELFSNYLDKPQNVDVSFDLAVDYKLSSFLTARAQVTLIYDDDQRVMNDDGTQSPRLQLRQMFGLGLAYRF